MLTIAGYSVVFVGLDGFGREIGRKPLYAVLACYAVSLFLPTLYLVYLCLFLVNPLLSRSRNESFTIFLICFVMMPALGEALRVASAYLFDVSAQTALSLGALASLGLRGGAKPKDPGSNQFFSVTIFVCLLIVEVRGTTLTGYVRGTAISLINLGLPYAVCIASSKKPDFQSRITVALSIAGGMLAMIAIFEILTSWPIFVVMNEHLGLHPSLLVAKLRGGHLRSAGPMGESTEMGFILAFCLLAAIVSRQGFRQASGYALTLGLIGVGLLAPQSKGGWIGAGLGIVALAAYRSTLARPGKFILASIFGGAFLYAALVFHPGEDPSQGSGVYRTRLLQRGAEEFWRSPLFGDNPPSVIVRMQDLRQGEHIVDFVNSYLWFALTLGALGLLAIIIAFLVPIVRAWRLRRLRGERDRVNEFAAFCFSCFISAMAMFAFTSFIPRAVILLMMFSAALMPRQRRHGAASVKTRRADLVDDPSATLSVQGRYVDQKADLRS